MKVIIAGGRTITDYDLVRDAIVDSGFAVTEVVSGGARGVDALGERWAAENGVPVKRFYANWNDNGRAAGPIRNRAMAQYADALILVWDGDSPGSASMLSEAHKETLLVFERDLTATYEASGEGGAEK